MISKLKTETREHYRIRDTEDEEYTFIIRYETGREIRKTKEILINSSTGKKIKPLNAPNKFYTISEAVKKFIDQEHAN
jgi:hypothetical protein